jgi:hypothetical protein
MRFIGYNHLSARRMRIEKYVDRNAEQNTRRTLIHKGAAKVQNSNAAVQEIVSSSNTFEIKV